MPSRRGHLCLATLFVLCTVILSCDYVSAARGGGGGRSGGGSRSSSSRSSSSYRSSSYRSSSTRRSSSSYDSSSTWRSSSSGYDSSSTSVRTKVRFSTTNVRYGSRYYILPPTVHVYGYSDYQTRHLYVSNQNYDPTVCYSGEDFEGNGTAIGYFICPMQDDSDSDTYCCGEDDAQYCCDFWGDFERTAGAVVGILIAVVVIVVTIVVLKKCCCPATATITHHKETVTSGATHETVPLASGPPAAMPGSYPHAAPAAFNGSGYVPQPDGGLQYPPQPAPGALNASGYAPQPDTGLPYPPQPGVSYGGSQASGTGLPYPVSGVPGQPYYPANPGEAQGIGFEGVTHQHAGSGAPYPPYPSAAQPQQPPPTYAEAVKL